MPGPFNPIDFGGLLGMWLALVPLWGPGIIFAGLRTKRTKAVRAVFSLEDIISLTLWAAIGNSLAITVRDELAAKSLAVLLAVVNSIALIVWFRGLRWMIFFGMAGRSDRRWFQFVVYPLSIAGPSSAFYGVMLFVLVLSRPYGTQTDNDVWMGICISVFFGVGVLISWWNRRQMVRLLLIEDRSEHTSPHSK